MYIRWLINLIILLIIAWIIGTEREQSGKDLGFRSLALLMLGAYSFVSCAVDYRGVTEYRIIAQIITGVSFVGAGLIFKDGNVHNLTTAITVWVCAAISILLGVNKVLQAIIVGLIVFILLSYKKKK